MLNIIDSNKSVQDIVDTIKEIAPKYKFGVQHIHKIQDTLKSKGFELKEECQIIDICNPMVANSFLSIDMSLSSIMPCKISVYTEKGSTKIALNSLVQLVDDINPDLIDIATTAQKELLQIINEAK